MKAALLKDFGTSYQIEEIENPIVKDGEVLVSIKASGINPLDLKIKSGNAAHAKTQLPAILGIDMAGIVVEVGKNIIGFKPGDEVFGMTGGINGVQGSLAQYASVDADLLAIKPKNLSMKEIASLPLAFITAWEGLVDRAKVSSKHKVLVHGGAGGVGHIAIQIAKSFGAEVFATGSGTNLNTIKKLGATPIDYTAQSVEDYTKLHTNGDGFDIIFDTVGGTTLDASFQAAKIYDGHVVSILGWGTHSLAPLSFRGATYSGVFTLLPLITGKGRKHHGEILQEATKLAESGKLKPIVNSENFTLENVEQAYEAIRESKTDGKVVVEIT